jgi:hypothetical protein
MSRRFAAHSYKREGGLLGGASTVKVAGAFACPHDAVTVWVLAGASLGTVNERGSVCGGALQWVPSWNDTGWQSPKPAAVAVTSISGGPVRTTVRGGLLGCARR